MNDDDDPRDEASLVEVGDGEVVDLVRVESIVDAIVAGELSGVEPSPAHDLWVVRSEGREHLIPAVPEIVREVDLGARRVVIRPPEGLLEL